MCMDSGPNRTQQAAHSADPRQLAAGPAGGTPPEELADPVALVSVGFRIRRWSERRIGATADQDRHRLGHQDHVDDRRVVEQNTMAIPQMRQPAVNARIPDGSGEDGDVAQRLRT
jgi:hypothetical protein